MSFVDKERRVQLHLSVCPPCRLVAGEEITVTLTPKFSIRWRCETSRFKPTDTENCAHSIGESSKWIQKAPRRDVKTAEQNSTRKKNSCTFSVFFSCNFVPLWACFNYVREYISFINNNEIKWAVFWIAQKARKSAAVTLDFAVLPRAFLTTRGWK